MNHPMNPILNADIFVPDAEAHVWDDGRMYLYGSLDIAGKKGYCSDEYHVYSSDNLIDWVDHGVSFRLSQAKWAEGNTALYAPDCAYKNGEYFLYYCVPDGRCGVAKSKSPYGPFVDIGPIEHVNMIDPAVFTDDDGQSYLYWGQFDGVRVAKLKENMTEIDPDTITQPLSVAEHEFHEGSSVRKINGKYYYLFTDTHRHGGRATSLGYAVSDNPMTGFEYKGVIIDNFGCDPETWNNHGSLECFNGQWYVFYHRSTHCSPFSRHVCMEPITINEDGSIDEVKMTTSVGKDAIRANRPLAAHRACEMSGTVYIATDAESIDGLAIRAFRSGDSAAYRYLAFDGEDTFGIMMSADSDCRAEVYIDDKYLTSLHIEENDTDEIFDVEHSPVYGTHTVTIRLFGDFKDAKISTFLFEKSEQQLRKEHAMKCPNASDGPYQLADWYWKSGLHDAKILSINELQLTPDYKEKRPKRNCLELYLDCQQALYERNIKKICFYNYKLKTYDVDLMQFDHRWWIHDTIQQLDNGHYLLEIEVEYKARKQIQFVIEFEFAETERT